MLEYTSWGLLNMEKLIHIFFKLFQFIEYLTAPTFLLSKNQFNIMAHTAFYSPLKINLAQQVLQLF